MIVNRNLVIPAGTSQQVTARGNFIRCLSSGGNILFIEPTYISGGSNTFEIEAGLAFETKEFSSFYVRNDSNVDVTVKLVISSAGMISDNRLVGQLDLNGAISVLSTLPKYSRFESIMLVSGSNAIVPENAARRSLVIVPNGEIVLDTGYTTDSSFEWNSQQSLSCTGTGVTVQLFEAYD
jgi:hypothetical protein